MTRFSMAGARAQRGVRQGLGRVQQTVVLDGTGCSPASDREVEARGLADPPTHGHRHTGQGAPSQQEEPRLRLHSTLVWPALASAPVLSADVGAAPEELWFLRGELAKSSTLDRQQERREDSSSRGRRSSPAGFPKTVAPCAGGTVSRDHEHVSVWLCGARERRRGVQGCSRVPDKARPHEPAPENPLGGEQMGQQHGLQSASWRCEKKTKFWDLKLTKPRGKVKLEAESHTPASHFLPNWTATKMKEPVPPRNALTGKFLVDPKILALKQFCWIPFRQCDVAAYLPSPKFPGIPAPLAEHRGAATERMALAWGWQLCRGPCPPPPMAGVRRQHWRRRPEQTPAAAVAGAEGGARSDAGHVLLQHCMGEARDSVLEVPV
ncbi:uncharacterized protein LOC129015189 [Pongo pygmaeus]|uniref:uncharacterized protein LOC129015189 n=1 Tax=Pongo pygmaeus TaxID=9600 RepID=UPI00300D5A88